MVKLIFSELKNLKGLTLANRKMECKYFHFSLDSVYKYCGQLQVSKIKNELLNYEFTY